MSANDNTTLNSQSGGDVIATEAILNPDGTTIAKVQLQKIMLGSPGVNGGTISDSNPMPVEDKRLLEVLEAILCELKRGNELLEDGL